MKNYNESINHPLCPNCGEDGWEVPEIYYINDIEEGKVFKKKVECPYCHCTYNIEYIVEVEITAIIKNSKRFKKNEENL